MCRTENPSDTATSQTMSSLKNISAFSSSSFFSVFFLYLSASKDGEKKKHQTKTSVWLGFKNKPSHTWTQKYTIFVSSFCTICMVFALYLDSFRLLQKRTRKLQLTAAHECYALLCSRRRRCCHEVVRLKPESPSLTALKDIHCTTLPYTASRSACASMNSDIVVL
jgi:hypothetical protein